MVNLAEATRFNGPTKTDMSANALSIEKKSVNATLRPCSDFPEVGKEVVINKPVKAGEVIMTYWGTWRSHEWVQENCGGESGDFRYKYLFSTFFSSFI